MDEKKTQSLNEVVPATGSRGDRVSLNEVVGKRYRLVRNHHELVTDSYDIGSLQNWIAKNGNDGSHYEIIDASTGQAVR